jgi:serine/threonine protein kinase
VLVLEQREDGDLRAELLLQIGTNRVPGALDGHLTPIGKSTPVYEYMANGTLWDHLHHQPPPSSASPVTASWKMRIDVLLGVSRAIEHLHCHAVPPVIHGDIKSSNILLDSSWVPRLSDFGISVHWDPINEVESPLVVGTLGYLDPEYAQSGHLKPSSDVYNLGVLMLEVLIGKEAIVNKLDLACFALPIIEAGDLKDLLDKRPSPEPTPRQLQALHYVAQTAACCVQMQGKDRPAISEVVAGIEAALEFMCSHDSTVDAVLCTRPKMWDHLRPLQNSYANDPLESEEELSDTEFTEPS